MKEEYESYWMWMQEEDAAEAQAGDDPIMVYFRRKLWLTCSPAEARVKISADSRYKLYVNGTFVEAGPSKGDLQVWYLDELNIAPWLREGENVIAVMVLRYSLKPACGNQSVIATPWPGLYFEGTCIGQNGTVYDFSTDYNWKYRINKDLKIVPEAQGFAPLFIYETCMASKDWIFWKQEEYDDSQWKMAKPYQKAQLRDVVSPGNLEKRTIPFLLRSPGRWKDIIQIVQSIYEEEKWMELLANRETLLIPANSEEIIEIDAGEEMTGYLRLLLSQGEGAEIEILQSEAYVQGTDERSGLPIKQDRCDYQNGHLEGYRDIYIAAGNGTEEKPEVYEPFWFRTFRFIRLHIKTRAHGMLLHEFSFEETGYPLRIQSQVETSDPSLTKIWDLSARTLKRCMHETYEDCPFYEQLQYAMDSRSQILYTYASAADDRLARKCMDDFRRAQRYDGMIPSAFPNTKPNVIPGFSIYYILMLHDHMMYFGDKKFILYHMSSVENILVFFERNLTRQGYVRKIGGPHRKEKFWSFIDWAEQWISGVPTATLDGPLTMESLLYVLGCQKAAELARFIGRNELALEYEKQAETVQKSIRRYCMDEEKILLDGPGVTQYSQHCQVFGVLTGTLKKEEGKKNLLRSIQEKERFAQCTVSMALYLFRALEKTGLYEHTDECWDIWRKMLKEQMTTSAESTAYCRSECHAWGALALYELPAVILGVRPAAPGFKKVQIQPHPGYLNWAKGSAATPKGMVHVSWKMEEGELKVEYQLPEEFMLQED